MTGPRLKNFACRTLIIVPQGPALIFINKACVSSRQAFAEISWKSHGATLLREAGRTKLMSNKCPLVTDIARGKPPQSQGPRQAHAQYHDVGEVA